VRERVRAPPLLRSDHDIILTSEPQNVNQHETEGDGSRRLKLGGALGDQYIKHNNNI